MGTLQIFLSEPIHTGQAESAAVKVEGATPGGQVDVTLTQVQGKQPFWGPQTLKGTVDTTGVAFVTFQMTFAGPSPMACLKATARDTTGTYYEPDAHSFEVLP
ncbi:hypothetical protein [Hyalangium gracile]|uniref:hypothetical protein n=1 Tax=Hyalangium gracile TaxID=394092 RepID=UPI001CCD809F|nr:hypothetical protein [Hyalangium gracile]